MSNTDLIIEIFRMVKEMVIGYYDRGLPTGMLLTHLNKLEAQVKENFAEEEKPRWLAINDIRAEDLFGYITPGPLKTFIRFNEEVNKTFTGVNPLARDSVGGEEMGE